MLREKNFFWLFFDFSKFLFSSPPLRCDLVSQARRGACAYQCREADGRARVLGGGSGGDGFQGEGFDGKKKLIECEDTGLKSTYHPLSSSSPFSS